MIMAVLIKHYILGGIMPFFSILSLVLYQITEVPNGQFMLVKLVTS